MHILPCHRTRIIEFKKPENAVYVCMYKPLAGIRKHFSALNVTNNDVYLISKAVLQ